MRAGAGLRRYTLGMRLVLASLALVVPLYAQKLNFDVQALMKIARISEPQLSPDGKLVAFTVETVDLEKNSKPKHIYVVPAGGGTAVQITREGTQNQRPRWMPDSKQLVFLSNRSGSQQIWSMNADGSAPKQIANLSTEAEGVTVSRDGHMLLFTSEVFPGCPDDACNQAKLAAEKSGRTQARIYDALLYRHWTKWASARRKHLLVMPAEGGKYKDLTPAAFEVPPFSLSGPDDYGFSPDGKEVAYAANTDADQATSTNVDLFTVPVTGGEAKRISTSLGADRSPVYSPDGNYIAFRSQQRSGYESDRWRLAVFERATGKVNLVNESQDRPVESLAWSPDSSRIFYVTEDRGRGHVQMIAAAGGVSRAITPGAGHIDDIQFAPDDSFMIYTEQTGSRPVEIYRASRSGGTPIPLARLNDAVIGQCALTPFEEFWVEAPDKSRVHSFVVKPPGFDPKRKYPVVFLIHGGPQSAWGESWSYRWNAQVFAGAGYVVVMPNPRGSTGYGQKFTDEINADWGGKVYEDIMAVVEHVAALSYTDANRLTAAGGSYGGYMVNWLLGHTDRFRALISHAGLYDLSSFTLETEELWFPLWEFRGLPWENPELYTQFSPGTYAKDFKTPTLVVHGEQDFRVPYGQGLQLFTALQMQRAPSKLLLFPDEGHWILKPQNSILWYATVLDWLKRWSGGRH